MHTSAEELTKYFNVWNPTITIMQRHDDLVDKVAPATPIEKDRVNQMLYMSWMYHINRSELCTRCGEGNMQALSGAIAFFPGLSNVPEIIYRDVCIGEVESLDHFIEHRIRVQMALSIQQALYMAGYGIPDIVWPRSSFDKPDDEKHLILAGSGEKYW